MLKRVETAISHLNKNDFRIFRKEKKRKKKRGENTKAQAHHRDEPNSKKTTLTI